MTDTEQTPVRVAADAVNRLPGANWLNSLRAARAAFGSIDVEGLAREINRHAPSDAPSVPGGSNCTCGDGPGAWEDIEDADRHVAEAVKAWLTGGGA